jgi:hypothetical protein
MMPPIEICWLFRHLEALLVPRLQMNIDADFSRIHLHVSGAQSARIF